MPRDVGKMLTRRVIYADDVGFDHETFGVVVRSPHSHARVLALDTSAGCGAPGVLAILAGEDVARIAGPLPRIIRHERMAARSRCTSTDRSLRLTECGTLGTAWPSWSPRPRSKRARRRGWLKSTTIGCLNMSIRSSPPRIRQSGQTVPDNLAFDWQFGDPARCKTLFAKAAHIVGIKVYYSRARDLQMPARSGDIRKVVAKWTQA